MTVGQRIKSRRLELDLSVDDVAIALNKNKATIYRYESDEITNLPANILEPLSKVLKTNPAFLLGWSDSPNDPSFKASAFHHEIDYDTPYDPIDNEWKHPSREARQVRHTRSLPILGTIRAGLPILAEGNVEDEIEAPSSIKADFALRVEGNSMLYAGILPGDIVLMKESNTAQSWDIVAAGVEEEEWSANLKYYVRTNGSQVLRSANPEYEDIPITPNHRIIGVMEGLIREGSPGKYDYQSMLNTSDRFSDDWLNLIVEATASGLSAKMVKQMIEVNKALLKQLLQK